MIELKTKAIIFLFGMSLFSVVVHASNLSGLSKSNYKVKIFQELKSKECKKGVGRLYKTAFNNLMNRTVESDLLKRGGKNESNKDYIKKICSVKLPKFPALGITVFYAYGLQDWQFNSNETKFINVGGGEISLNDSYNSSICYTRAIDRKNYTNEKFTNHSQDYQIKLGKNRIAKISAKCKKWHFSVLKDVKAEVAKQKKSIAYFNKLLSVVENENSYRVWGEVKDINNKQVDSNSKYFNELNMFAWDKTYRVLQGMESSISIKKPEYSPPKTSKGEFEKLNDFKLRKGKDVLDKKKEYAKEIAKYEKNILKRKKEYDSAKSNKVTIFHEILIKDFIAKLGKAEIKVSYSADKEEFIIEVTGKRLKGYAVIGRMPFPIKKAVNMKRILEGSAPYLVYHVVDGRLKVQRMVLKASKDSFLISSLSDNLASYSFTENDANKYRVVHKSLLKKAEEKRRLELEAENKRKQEVKSKRREESKMVAVGSSSKGFTMTDLGQLILLLGSILVFLAPTIISLKNNHPFKVWVIFVNLVFGATGIGWLAALIWSLITPKSIAKSMDSVDAVRAKK